MAGDKVANYRANILYRLQTNQLTPALDATITAINQLIVDGENPVSCQLIAQRAGVSQPFVQVAIYPLAQLGLVKIWKSHGRMSGIYLLDLIRSRQ